MRRYLSCVNLTFLPAKMQTASNLTTQQVRAENMFFGVKDERI